MTSFVLYEKNIVPQPDDQFMVFTQLVQSRVMGSPVTIAKQVEESRLPQAALDPAFRKITRNRGAIMRKVAPEEQPGTRTIVAQLNEGKLTAAPTPPEPTGSILVDKMADTDRRARICLNGFAGLIRNKNARLILIVVMIVALVLAFVTGLFVVFVPIIIVAGRITANA